MRDLARITYSAWTTAGRFLALKDMGVMMRLIPKIKKNKCPCSVTGTAGGTTSSAAMFL